MRVEIELGVLADPHAYGAAVRAILETFDTGQHQWLIEDLEEVLASAYMRERALWDACPELAEKSFRKAIDEPASPTRWKLMVSVQPGTSRDDTPRTRYESPGRAREILTERLYVVVENGAADWGFMKALIQTHSRETLADAIAKHWIIEEHAGGSGNLRSRTEALLARKIASWRIYVLMDSDSLTPGSLPASNKKIVRALADLGVQVHPWLKRETENYLPYALLPNRDTLANRRRSFMELTREQQDHYDMKTGFTKRDGQPVVPLEQQNLFQGISKWHLEHLCGGFGSNVGAAFQEATISREELEVVCKTCPEELERVLDAIEELL